MSAPLVLNINMDVPVDFKVKAMHYGVLKLFAFNFMYSIVVVYDIVDNNDGSPVFYSSVSSHAFMEIKGGLAYYDYGWKIFDNDVQEKYAEYVMENEVLSDKK